jgi:catechol 2,3-dioxygenase-like lactoylglutathione lyase family enzyme
MTTGTSRGLPGLRGAEHIGFTVPNLDQATAFFVDVIGCELDA